MLNNSFEQDLIEQSKKEFDQPKDYFWLQCSVLILLSLGLMAFFAYTLYYLIQP
jgi:hypothetical protein